MELERRQTARISTNRDATIRAEDASFVATCEVCNLSEGGAKLMVEDGCAVPKEFVLFLRAGSSVGRRCCTIWRVGNKIGIRFVSVEDLSARGQKGSGVWAPE